MRAHPLQRKPLVEDSQVFGAAPGRGRVGEAEDVGAVVERDEHDVVGCGEGDPGVEDCVAGSEEEGPAVQPYEHGGEGAAGGGPDVEREAVFALRGGGAEGGGEGEAGAGEAEGRGVEGWGGGRGGGSAVGGVNRRVPVGGRAYGMPRYSWTVGLRRLGRPWMVPNVPVTVGVAGAASGAAEVRGRGRVRAARTKSLRAWRSVIVSHWY